MNGNPPHSPGMPLHLVRWAAAAPARGTVVLVHGLGEHCGRYAWLAGELVAAGWEVFGYDHRGHGASDGQRGAIGAADSLLVDLARVLDEVRGRGAVAPLVLLGHSMGGVVAARFVAEALEVAPAAWSRPVDALVLSSPALAVDATPLQKVLLAVAGPLAPNLPVHNGLDPAWISHDAAVVAAYVADPLVHDRITPRLGRFIVEAGAFARATAPRWRLPTLLMWGGADRCVAPRGSAAFAAAAPPGVVQARPWPALAHEIFNEPVRDEVVAELMAWLGERVAPPPARGESA